MVIRSPVRSQLIPVSLSLMLDRAEMSRTQFTFVPEVVQPSGPGGGAVTVIVCVSTSVAPSLSVTVSVTVKSVVGFTTAKVCDGLVVELFGEPSPKFQAEVAM